MTNKIRTLTVSLACAALVGVSALASAQTDVRQYPHRTVIVENMRRHHHHYRYVVRHHHRVRVRVW